MPKRSLTDRFCQHAKVADGEVQTDYYDEGCPGLALRVSGRSKTWTYFVTIGTKRHRLRLGTYPATSLARAHTLADGAKADLEARRDPRASLATPETLRSVGEEWVGREGKGLRTGNTRKATLERLVYPTLGDRPIADIRRSEIVRLLDGIEDTQGPAAADKTLAFIRAVMNWYASRSDDFRSPIVRGMARTKPRERARARILTDDEIRTVWTVAEGQGPFGKLVQFLLLTGARRTEAAAMPWTELDGDQWLLPGPRNKTKLDLVRPLPPTALAVLGPRPPDAVFVFSTDGGATPLSGFSKFKLTFDKACGVTDYTIHDLRRSARSLMSRAGVPTDHAERVLGHVIGGVRGTYDRHEYLDEKRDALASLARLVDRIIAGRPTELKLVRVTREVEANG
jgi:integrase